MEAQDRTPADVLEAAGVGLLDEETLKDWPPKPKEDGEGESKAEQEETKKEDAKREDTKKASLLFFTAPWCEVSLEAAPRFARLSEEFSGRAEFNQVDADRAPLAAERLNVRSVPAIVAFARGNEISRRVGLADQEELDRLVKEAIEEAAAGGDEADVGLEKDADAASEERAAHDVGDKNEKGEA